MKQNKKEYWITNSRFKYGALIMLIIWLSLLLFFFLEAEAVTKDPCSICAKRMGENVVCLTQGIPQLQRTYYPNYSIYNSLVGE